jgi:uncharacterized protein
MSFPFHLAFPVKNIDASKKFYIDHLGCKITKSTERWLNIDFFGHQLSIYHYPHLVPDRKTIMLEGHQVPLHHFGVILKKKEWNDLSRKLKRAKVKFLIDPKVRHEGQLCEQRVMFMKDPGGHGIEFKCYTNPKHIFSEKCVQGED